jgi:hypothetical protein
MGLINTRDQGVVVLVDNSINNSGNMTGNFNTGDNVSQNYIATNPALNEAFSELLSEISSIRDQNVRMQMELNAETLKTAVESKDAKSGEKVLTLMRNTLGNISSLITIGGFLATL